MHDDPDAACPIVVEYRKFVDIREVGKGPSAQPLPVSRQDKIAVFRGDHVGNRPFGQFGIRVAGQFRKRRIMEDKEAVLCNEDCIIALFDNGTVLGLALVQSFFNFFPIGDVREHPERSRKCPVGGEEGCCGGQAPYERPVFPDPPALVAARDAPWSFCEFLLHRFDVIRRYKVPDRAPQHLLCRIAEQLLHLPVGKCRGEPGIYRPDPLIRRFNNDPVSLFALQECLLCPPALADITAEGEDLEGIPRSYHARVDLHRSDRA